MIPYTIQKSLRAKNIRITITSDARVVVTVPNHVSTSQSEKFVHEKMDWIEKHVARIQKRLAGTITIPKASIAEYKELKDKALLFTLEKIKEVNSVYSFTWNSISIKNTSSRWGSCSKQGNLNFNYRIIYLSEELQKYLLAHELCHLKEMNHSERFWKLVEKAIPNYKESRKLLKTIF